MIFLCLAATTLAVTGWLGPPAELRTRHRLAGVSKPGRRRLPWSLAVCGAAGTAVAAAAALFGGTGAAVAASALIAAGSSVLVVRGVLRARTAARTRRDVAHACQLLARLVDVGQVPTADLRLAAEDCPVLAEAAAIQALGGDPTQSWRSDAARPGRAGLLALARAWRVSGVTGAPMARPLQDVAAALAAQESVATVVTAELSAPRATGRLLAVLPLFGLVLGFVIGGNPLSFLLQNRVGEICLVLGVALASAGVLWVERLAGQGARM